MRKQVYLADSIDKPFLDGLASLKPVDNTLIYKIQFAEIIINVKYSLN